jgi:hypothetical protein
MTFLRTRSRAAAATAFLALACVAVQGSSHREAPAITATPKVDGTDFYMFRSYEPGRADFVTLIANYVPLQDPYGGPNYFALDPDALYEIHLDNNGDAVEDITFQFRPAIRVKNIAVPAGGVSVAVPLINVGTIGPGADDTDSLNREETYTLNIIRGDRRKGTSEPIVNAADGGRSFRKPVDNIGMKSIPQYSTYAGNHVYDIDVPGCDEGRVFVGQRKDPFVVNLGETFDLVNVSNPLGAEDAEADDLADKNVTSFILEVPISCIVRSASQPIVGGWTTASMGSPHGQGRNAKVFYTQVSRLGSPLVNEVVIGLKDKDLFNSAKPTQDSALATYVTNPTLPELLEILFGAAGVRAPNNFPRNDLVAAFLTGVSGLNQPAGLRPSEMLRLNTSVGALAPAGQSRLGVLGGDLAGFPNGRRPGDDVVDIELRVAMGVLCHAFPGAFGCGPADAPSGLLPFTDGAFVDASFFDSSFPYLRTPLPGSPNGTQ